MANINIKIMPTEKCSQVTMPFMEFDMKNGFPANAATLLVAKRGSGKTVFIKNIVSNFTHIPLILVVAPTDDFNASESYSSYIPDICVFNEYDPEIFSRILKRQKTLKMKNKKRKAEGKRLIDTRVMIIMDDCLADKKTWVNDANMRTILFNGRHYDIMYILTIQDPLGIPPMLRTQFDVVILLADDNVQNIEKCYKSYAGMLPNVNAFREIHAQMTENYGAMIILHRGAKASITEKIFWYQSEQSEKLGPNRDGYIGDIGSKQLKKYFEDNYNKNWADDMDDDINDNYDITNYGRKKNMQKINVAKTRR